MPAIVELKMKFVLHTKSIWGEHYNGDCKIIASIFYRVIVRQFILNICINFIKLLMNIL